ncbi:TilS substrate-binding domain-containing protein [Escherichia coli]
MQWALAHGLRWIEDESNQDDSYDRSFLRLRVVPLLQQRWPHFAETTARSAALCAEQESLLDELRQYDLAHCQSPQGTLQIVPMLAMSDARRAAIIRRWLAGQNAPMPSRRVGEDLAGSGAGRDASPCLRLGAFEIRRYQSQLWWIKSVTGKPKTLCRGRRGFNRWNYRRGWEVAG